MTEFSNAVRGFVMRTPVYLRLRDFALRAHRDNFRVIREDMARRYLSGTGIEIGALTMPLRVPPDVRVRHVDRKSRAALLREDGPGLEVLGLDPSAIPEIDIVDDASRLAAIDDGTMDFVIANHVLEHLEDPIEALENFLRVLRVGGIVLLTLPDPRYTFDAPRGRTSVEHVLRDHRQGPAVSRRDHYEEWARFIEGTPDDSVAEQVEGYAREDARHHFHVWELDDFLELLRALTIPAEITEARVYGIEFAIVLRRSRDQAAASVP
jgi:predicted SAM-dependent methyltransferase